MSMGELMVIGVIALIVIGPERLPKVARTVGHLLGRAQRYVNDVKGDIRREIELDELRKFKSEMEDAAQTVQTSMRDTTEALREPAQALRQELDDAAKAASGALSLSTPVVDEDGQPAHVDPPADAASVPSATASGESTAHPAAEPATGSSAIVGADPTAGTRVETGALPAAAIPLTAQASPGLTIPAEVAGQPRVATGTAATASNTATPAAPAPANVAAASTPPQTATPAPTAASTQPPTTGTPT